MLKAAVLGLPLSFGMAAASQAAIVSAPPVSAGGAVVTVGEGSGPSSH